MPDEKITNFPKVSRQYLVESYRHTQHMKETARELTSFLSSHDDKLTVDQALTIRRALREVEAGAKMASEIEELLWDQIQRVQGIHDQADEIRELFKVEPKDE